MIVMKFAVAVAHVKTPELSLHIIACDDWREACNASPAIHWHIPESMTYLDMQNHAIEVHSCMVAAVPIFPRS